MNRNAKHPDRPYRRRAVAGDHTPNSRGYRVTASWDARPDRPAIRTTPDKAKARRMAREYAEQGAYVVLEEHRGRNQWRTVRELDGPAIVAERRAAEQAARAAREAAQAAADAARLEQLRADRRRRRLAAEATTHARELMTPPAIVRPEHRQRARHVTGAQR
ncbi:hypothetical protein RI578_22845 [Streptomyces sp. BB1-1-1]|uniref:hypothetical protein n=1 Tax=Streptomyces sp. BB1-1-1 TaxID=3074430 RepID=UPI002877E34C|nr:hypothetical protein [Streptomyces sp. BB1-1-1]WND36949.1 hypothetical protein RI578_22845 [Streptomyces sp. BB1-1-1]